MKIAYLITAHENPLYEGKFLDNGVYLSFGQHSFIYDLVLSILSNKVIIEFHIDGANVFPLNRLFSDLKVPIYELTYDSKIDADIIIIDTLADSFLIRKYKGYKIGIIHNYMVKHSSLFYSECDAIICMTPYAIERQKKFYPINKFHLIRQGVFCNRFYPTSRASSLNIQSVLFYSRMDKYKGKAYQEIIEGFLDLGLNVSILGAGDLYDYFKSFFGRKINYYSHISCHDIPRIINDFDLIVSNGRGVMEGMSANKPTIAAGIRYCGLITEDNIIEHRDRNFTGAYMSDKPINLELDLSLVSHCYQRNKFYFSNLAQTYLNVDNFFKQLITLKEDVCI